MRRSGGPSPVDYYYHTDDIYNVMAVTDATGAVVERYDYRDYGLPVVYDASGTELPGGTAIGNPYLFNGRRWDRESRLYYYRTRYMDPRAGRFITRDSIGIWGDASNLGNGYTYAGSNPWSALDPTGLQGRRVRMERVTSPETARWQQIQEAQAEAAANAPRMSFWDKTQMGIDGLGMIPAAGNVADGVNVGISLLRGNWSDAGLSLAAMIPGLGQGATAGKWAKKLEKLKDCGNVIDNGGDIGKTIVKSVDDVPHPKVHSVYGDGTRVLEGQQHHHVCLLILTQTLWGRIQPCASTR